MPSGIQISVQKLEEAKALIDGLSKDLQGLLSMAQMSIPLGEQAIRHFSQRAAQVQKLFRIVEEKTDGQPQ